MRWFEADHLLVDGARWLSPGRFNVGADGLIGAVQGGAGPRDAVRLRGFVVPGVPNVHSHTFQRGMAGLAEHGSAANPNDDFWTWRETMYAFAAAIEPPEVEAVAAMAFVEMLEAGYTTVAEFHYLHNDRDGTPYADPAELTGRVVAAADRTGIALTLLPVLYQHGGIGKPLAPRQRRFAHAGVDAYLRAVEGARRAVAGAQCRRVGIAPHSLRAVGADELAAALAGAAAIDPTAPIHQHAAEQEGEVAECTAALGAPPIAWLFANHRVDARWCLVHCTHANADERELLARSGAVAGLCPSTEANLGDGLFAAAAYLAAGGAFGVGTDSQIAIDPAAELRQLEYGERLARRRRNVLARGAEHVGTRLLLDACAGGARAIGQPVGALSAGRRADFLVLDPAADRLVGHGPDTAADAWVFSAGRACVREAWVAGEQVVQDGRHRARPQVAVAYREAMASLVARL
jgi:formiminoglutamate deiminase